MRTLACAVGLAAVVLPSGGAARPAPDAATESCSFAAPVVLPEPAYTRGESNTIRWEHVPKHCWIGEDNSGKASTNRRFTVTITNRTTGKTASVTVHGEDEVDATIDPGELPRGPNGEIDGVRFDYVVVRKEKWCSSGSPFFGTCTDTLTRTSHPSDTVSSTQDTRSPSGSLQLADGAAFVPALRVSARVTASDPAGAGGNPGSGAGYVVFGSSPQLASCRGGCVQSLSGSLSVQLEPGSDGIRTVQARVYDRARGAADDPGATAIGTPPGNVSPTFTAAVIVDRTPPLLSIRVSTVRATVGVPVILDASRSTDEGGFNADSGMDGNNSLWTFGDGTGATGLVASHAYSAVGTYRPTFAGRDRVANVQRVELDLITVVAAPVPPEPRTTTTPTQTPTAPPSTIDRTAPSLSALAVRRRGGKIMLAFRISERATLAVEARRTSPRPQRTLGSFSRPVLAGRRELPLPAALARRLRATGTYRFALVARDASGNRTRVRYVRLTVR